MQANTYTVNKKGLSEITMKTYMNINTGSVAPAGEWTYTDEDGVEVNAVELGELVEVVWNKEKDCWIEV